MSKPIPLYQFTQDSSIQFLLITPEDALVLDKHGALIAITKDPNAVLMARVPSPPHLNLADNSLYDENTEILCEAADALVVWHDFYLGTPHFETASILHSLHLQGLYTGYVPVIAEVSWCVLRPLLDDNETQAREEIDIRPVLDTIDDMTLSAWLHPTSIDKPHSVSMARVIGICVERYLVDTESPIKPAPENCMIETSMSLAQYAQRFRNTPATDDELQEARRKLDALTYTATSRLINTINETRRPILERWAHSDIPGIPQKRPRASLWLVIDQEAGGIIACTETADEAYTVARNWADAHYPDQPLEAIEGMEVRKITSGEILV